MAVLKVRSSGDSTWYTVGGWPSISDTNYFLDEDDMASDSATHGATQQSIKAYVDSTTAGTQATSGATGYILTSSISIKPRTLVIYFVGVSTSAANQPPVVQFANSTTWQASSYFNYISYGSGKQSYTIGFYSHDANNWAASDTVWCTMTFHALDTGYTRYSYTMVGQVANESSQRVGNGYVNLTSAINGIRLTTPGGAATYDLGSVYWSYF